MTDHVELFREHCESLGLEQKVGQEHITYRVSEAMFVSLRERRDYSVSFGCCVNIPIPYECGLVEHEMTVVVRDKTLVSIQTLVDPNDISKLIDRLVSINNVFCEGEGGFADCVQAVTWVLHRARERQEKVQKEYLKAEEKKAQQWSDAIRSIVKAGGT